LTTSTPSIATARAVPAPARAPARGDAFGVARPRRGFPPRARATLARALRGARASASARDMCARDLSSIRRRVRARARVELCGARARVVIHTSARDDRWTPSRRRAARFAARPRR